MNNIKSNKADSPLYLIDGSGFIFRAFYALPPLTRPDGTPVGAVMGFVNMLTKFLMDMKAENVAVIFDAARENFRNEIYDEYKANRAETPPDLIPQFPLIRESVEAFSLPSIELEGYEADDLIAAYSKKAEEAGRKVVVVSSDKDLMQLVGGNISMFDPMKNADIDEEAVFKKFGVSPDKVIDVQALAGDSSDNIPGVPGIGVKTAALLINEYGNLEDLLERAEEIKQPKRRQNLIEFAELARISKKLVTLDKNTPLPLPIKDLKPHELDIKKLSNFLHLQGFNTTIKRVEKKLLGGKKLPVTEEIKAHNEENISVDAELTDIETNYTCITNMSMLNDWIEEAKNAPILAIDTETDSLLASSAKLVGISLSVKAGEACYIPLQHQGEDDGGGLALMDDRPEQVDMKAALGKLKPLFEDLSMLKIGHNLKYDMQVLKQHDLKLFPYEDTLLLSYCLDGRLHGHGLDELSLLNFNHKNIKYADIAGKGKKQLTFDRIPLDKAAPYAAEDADMAMRLYIKLRSRLVKEKMTTLYERIERPLVAVIASMEYEGIRVDKNILNKLSVDFGAKIAEIGAEIFELAGEEFNIASPKQLGEILFDKMGLEGSKKSKTGQWSTAVNILEPLADENEIIQKILDWRQYSKLKSTYSDALVKQINPKTERVHTRFSLSGTSTGRIASSDPNLQNIPIRTEEGRKIRTAFIARDGYKLLSADYSQVELRLMAELADVKSMKQAFADKMDIHATTASQIFGVPLEDMTPEIRSRAKAINFGVIYGISAFGLSNQTGISTKDAKKFIDTYLDHYHEIRDYMEAQKSYAHDHGYVKTLYGRKCFTRGINNKNHAIRSGAERAAINAPLQGTAADIIKRAMIQIQEFLEKEKLKTKMLLQVHDELIFEIPTDEEETTPQHIKKIMENAAGDRLATKLLVEMEIADNWNDAH